MSGLRAALVLLPFCTMPILGCHSNLSWVPDGNGHVMAFHHQPVKLPGLEYLSLGSPQGEVLSALRNHGFECDSEASTSRTQACIRAPGEQDPKGGEIVLEFEHMLLSGVQAQLQPAGDETGKLSALRYGELLALWTRAYGRPVEARRAGITAARYTLHNGTALLLVRYDQEPTLLAEHLQVQHDQPQIPGMRESP